MTRKRTVHDLPQPLRALAWGAAYVLLFGIAVGRGTLAGWCEFRDEWSDTLRLLREAGK